MGAKSRRVNLIVVVGALVYAALFFASVYANFVPIGVEGWIVVGSSSLLGVTLLPALPRERIARLSAPNRRWFYFCMWLLGAMLWVPIVGLVLPVATSYVYATPAEKHLTVARKRSPTIRWSCLGIVFQEYEELLDNTICVSPSLWESLSQGSTVRVIGMENRLGFRVQEIHAR